MFDSDKTLHETPPATGEVRRFPAGATAPQWLFQLEPHHPRSVAAPITFAGPVEIIDTGSRFVLLPLWMGVSQVGILVTEAQGCNIFAATKEVRVVTHAAIVHIDPTQIASPAEVGLFTQLSPAPGASAVPEARQEVSKLSRFLEGAGVAGLAGLGTLFIVEALRAFMHLLAHQPLF